MKKIIPVVISTVLTLPLAATAQAEGPIDGAVYGKINAAIINHDKAGNKDTSLDSNASRLGFKGETTLDKGITVMYQLEYEIDPTEKSAESSSKSTGGITDTAASTGGQYKDTNIFKQRNAYVGVKGSFGSILAGTHDTPLKLAQGDVDQFNDLPVGDIKNLMRGEVRANDIVLYSSPTFSGVTLMAAATQYEDTDEGKNNANSFSLNYENDSLYAAVAVDSEVAGYDVTRISAAYKMNAFTVGAIYNSSEAINSTTASKDSQLISASYKMGDYKVKAQYGSGDEYKTGDQLAALGVDYKLGSKSKLYAYTAKYSNDSSNSSHKVMGLGVEHKF